MVVSWPDELGAPPQAWVWFVSADLDKRDTSFKLDGAQALIAALLDKLVEVERDHKELLLTVKAALHELGVPGEGYPAPVENAVALLETLVPDE
jgi:hypothetical protein